MAAAHFPDCYSDPLAGVVSLERRHFFAREWHYSLLKILGKTVTTIKGLVTGLVLVLLNTTAFGDEIADRLAAVPNPRTNFGWVADPAGVIAKRTGDINQLLTKLERDTSTEIAVAVLPTIGHLDPKSFAVALMEHWKVGKAGKDNGILVLHVLDQRRIEIETGYGLEGTLPDAKIHWILQEIAIPFFKKDSIADGHYEVVRALVRAVEQPQIKRTDLISSLVTQPGSTTDIVPDRGGRDDIAVKYSTLSEHVVYGKWTPIVLLALGTAAYLWIAGWYRTRSRDKAPYAKYQLFNSGISRLQYVSLLPVAAAALVFEHSQTATFFSPIPVLLLLGFVMLRQRSSALKSLRDEPRICHCGKSMRRLDEHQDDAYIEKGNVAEESIGSVDYDVWLCDDGHSAIESYKGRSPAAACSQCSYQTYRVTNTSTLHPATTVSAGLREITYTCANCQYQKIDKVIIPVITNSSGRSGSGSGRSSGSFGGGRSGGGGAGSSY